MHLATKVSPENLNFESLIKSCENSLKRLKVDFIDYYQIHWPNPDIPFEETMDAMLKLYNDNKIKKIGLCNYTLADLKTIQKYCKHIPISSLQMEYNLNERLIENDGTLDYCIDEEIILLAYSPLDQGQFSIIDKNKLNVLKKISLKYEKTIQQIILNFLTRFSNTIAITRTTSEKHLMQNINAMSFKMDKTDVKTISKIFQF